jgi:methylmalonyl-CoA/ethylmalonyl-CoA epimerase
VKILGINHIGLAAADPQKARWFLKEVLGLPFEGEELVITQKTNTVMFATAHENSVKGHSRLEILENPAGEDGPIAKYLEKKGGGIHHLALTVADIDAAIAHLKKLGVQMIDETPRNGAHHTRIAFVHPKATGGILVELVGESHS